MQIKLNKPLTDLNHLLMRNNLQPTPKRKSLINPFPSKNHKENQLNVTNISRSPTRSISRKTINSKDDSLHSLQNQNSRNRAKSRKADLNRVRMCQNHEDREGSFHINIQGQNLFYCQKCAMKLKSQGFPIHQAHQNASNQDSSVSYPKNSLLSVYSNYQGHPQFEVLKELLASIYQSQQKMLNSKITNEFFSQIEINLDKFYDSVEELIRAKRDQSRVELQLIKKKWNDYELTQAVDQIQMMKKDIEENIEQIIGEVEEDTFYQCVSNYKERISALNKIGENSWVQSEKLKQKYTSKILHEIQALKEQIHNIQSNAPSLNSQNVICSEANDLQHFNQDQKGYHKNTYMNEKQKVKKRLISRK